MRAMPSIQISTGSSSVNSHSLSDSSSIAYHGSTKLNFSPFQVKGSMAFSLKRTYKLCYLFLTYANYFLYFFHFLHHVRKQAKCRTVPLDPSSLHPHLGQHAFFCWTRQNTYCRYFSKSSVYHLQL